MILATTKSLPAGFSRSHFEVQDLIFCAASAWELRGVTARYFPIRRHCQAPLAARCPVTFHAGQQQFFAYNPVVGPVVGDGQHWRLSPQGFYNYGPFGVLGEYGISDQGVLNSFTLNHTRLRNTAWEVTGQWVLTGEPASLNGIVPDHPFDLAGGWGAWQLVGRLSGIDIDPMAFQGYSDPTLSAGSADSWSLGLNWWLNRNVRFMISFSQTHFHGGGQVNPNNLLSIVPPATVSHQDENVWFSRIQLAF